MPSIQHISSTFFVNLLNRLGVKPPFNEPFSLINTVQPVSIVDSDIVLTSVSASQLLDIPASAGELAAPVINTVLCDSGPQAAGNYLVTIILSFTEQVNQQKIAVQRRDSANAVNIWEQRFYNNTGAGGQASFTVELNLRCTLQLNERIRLINLVAGGAASTYHANIWLLLS